MIEPVARRGVTRINPMIGLFDEHKVETRHPVESLDEIYQHAAEIRYIVKSYI